MPTYEYACGSCSHHWEEIQKISEPPVEVCPKCAKQTAKRQISGGNFILKGGGWYADLYSSPRSGGGDKASTPESGSNGAAPKGDGKSGDASTAASPSASNGGSGSTTGGGSSGSGSSGSGSSGSGSSAGGGSSSSSN